MEHAMNEKMREMVGKGELSEASYKHLVDELGRQKEEADAPLFVVTYTANMIIARIRSDDDDGIDYATQSPFKLHGPLTKIVRGVTKQRPPVHDSRLTDQFVDFDEIRITRDNEPQAYFAPGYTIFQDCGCGATTHGSASHESCVIVYTIIKVSKFQKRKSSVLSEE